MNEFETKHGTLPVITASCQDRTITVIKGQGPRQVRSSFTFDNVFSAFSSQKEIFDATLKPVIRWVILHRLHFTTTYFKRLFFSL
jgi:hypothetical protein